MRLRLSVAFCLAASRSASRRAASRRSALVLRGSLAGMGTRLHEVVDATVDGGLSVRAPVRVRAPRAARVYVTIL
ncbi:hypothetical protein GCM10027212_06130 [Actinotalea caeni]